MAQLDIVRDGRTATRWRLRFAAAMVLTFNLALLLGLCLCSRHGTWPSAWTSLGLLLAWEVVGRLYVRLVCGKDIRLR